MLFENGWEYELCRFWIRLLYFLFLVDIDIKSKCTDIPEKGIIIASNHASNLDPPLILEALPCRLSFVAKKELFDIPYFGILLKSLNMIPVNRSAFKPSTIKSISERIKENNILIFPEGTRTRTGEIGEGKPGFGYMVKKIECSVLPIYIDSFDILKKGELVPNSRKVRIHIGELLTFENIYDKIYNYAEKEQYLAITNLVIDRIKALKET